jgi:GH24 family phage-related lysozyme (muramidase)
MKISPKGIQLIKSFEGLRLSAYVDAVGVPTIGWGHTGSVAQKALATKEPINETAAALLLSNDLKRFEDGVSELIPVPLTQGQFDALVSFSFNVGLSALRDSTLRKRIIAGESINLVIKEELPRWNKGDRGVLEGLTRRRNAEVKLATEQVTEQVTAQLSGDSGYMVRAAENYKGLPHQRAAYQALEGSLTIEQFKAFKAAYSPAQAPVEGRPKVSGFPLPVPYFYQRDSKTGNGERMCFSSSMAMALDYLNPEAIQGDDDWYLQQVFKYGDSVSSEAQLKAAHALGYEAEFHTDGKRADLERLLDAGVPVPIGILHKGNVSSPTGGGHWICLIGHDDDYFMVHDPFGELDLVNGGYPKAGPTDGQNQLYSKKNLMKRWNIANDHDGWYMDLTQK